MSGTPYNWRQKFAELERLSPTAPRQDKAQRGRDFEAVLSAMFDEAGLQPRLQYRPRGEELDGSIWLDGRTILIEAKWTEAPHPASSIYQFKGKVDGKLVGTLGLFISINGFSKDAVDALILGKELNIVLADGIDMRALVDGRIDVVDLLRRKLRAAGDEGDVYWTFAAIEAVGGSRAQQTTKPNVRRIVVVEGRNDVRYLEAVRRSLGFTDPITFIPAGGALNVPRQVRALSQGTGPVAITALVDADVDPRFLEEMQAEFHSRSNETGAHFEVIAADPDLETALGLNPEGVAFAARTELRRPSDVYLARALSEANLLERARENESLRSIIRVIG